MFVTEKGKYFSAITMQQFFKLDTEDINNEIINLKKMEIISKQSKIVNY